MPTITAEQVLALAPDPASAKAGKGLASPAKWKNLGHSDQGLWGECQGSALYQVRIDLATLSTKCSCPSRKFPCKHGLGLLLLHVAAPDAVPTAEPPEWMASWLAKRNAPPEAAKPKASAKSPEQAAAEAAKRIAKREKLVLAGLDSLDLWLNDLVRNGLGELATASTRQWEAQAARLVDAQAGALAGKLRRMGGIPGASKDWADRLLGEMGKVALLTHAYRQQYALDPSLREDVRQLVGWTLTADEVEAHGDQVSDEWAVLGQWIDAEDRVKVQRTWLQGMRSGRVALIMQFSAAGQSYGDTYLPGTRFEATLSYWPSACPLRARVKERASDLGSLTQLAGGHGSIEGFLRTYAEALGKQPWLDRLGGALRDVVPVSQENRPWRVRDAAGLTLPLAGRSHWQLMALSGGHPVTLAGEWDGEAFLPLGVLAEGTYTALWGGN